MIRSTVKYAPVLLIIIVMGPLGASPSPGQQVKLVERLPDPHRSPRPSQAHVRVAANGCNFLVITRVDRRREAHR